MVLEATRGDEHAALERADGLVESVDGAAEAVATSLGLAIQLPTFAGVPPHLDGRRVGRPDFFQGA